MSFTISYIEFFKVRTINTSDSSPLQSIFFSPSNECKKILNQHRLVFKPRIGGFDIFYQRNPYATDPVIAPITKRTRFNFKMIISDLNFFKVYEPDFDVVPQLYFDNLDNNGNILNGPTEVLTEGSEVNVSDSMKMLPVTFTVNTDMSIAPTPTEYRIKEKFNPTNTLQSVAIENPLGLINVRTKLNDPLLQQASYINQAGPYLLETDSGQPAARTIYLDNELVKQEFNGIVDIYWETSQENADPSGNVYEIRFKPR
ncbi:hypothetical protein OO013_08320 [Mangrovivirga sp. M17]|uniref:Uncharacterized protein n=1 Tax=Mangrovivirga halotolerans TaxID=2993936 RepID=A0ABT3RQ01_9BACT|nr:hypothetical protein [Mangrovivirga halotolerans]MCX2743867.1 hypothetical protein [Mangrovivirga halotolerans]